MERNNYYLSLEVTNYEANQLCMNTSEEVKEKILQRVIDAINYRDSQPDDFYTALALKHFEKGKQKQYELDLK